MKFNINYDVAVVDHDMRYNIEVFMWAEIDVTLHHLLYILGMKLH